MSVDMHEVSGSGFHPDPNNSKKQVGWTAPQPSTSFVPVMSTTERNNLNPISGSMVFSLTDNHLYVWDGSTWKDVTTP